MGYKVLNHELEATTPQVLAQLLESMEEEGWRLVDIVQVKEGTVWTIHQLKRVSTNRQDLMQIT